MKIVIEYVLLESLLINLIILKTTSLLVREKGRLFLLSAFLGACMTVAIPALGVNAIGQFLITAGLGVVLICILFRFKSIKKFAMLFVSYFVANLIYGGACFFFEGLFGAIPTILLLVLVVGTYFVVRFCLKKFGHKSAVEKFCMDVQIESKGKVSRWRAFLDTGNFLFDPVTDSPVSLINFKVFSSLFEDIGVDDLLRHSDKVKGLKFAHYINLNTLGGADKILVFQVDKLCVGQKVLDCPTLGLSLKAFNEAFGTDIILHNSLA